MKIEIKVERVGRRSYTASAIGDYVKGYGKTAAEAKEQAEQKLDTYLARLRDFVPCVRQSADGTIFVLELNAEGYGYTMVRNQERYLANSACYFSAESQEEAISVMLRHFNQYNHTCA